MTIEKKAAGQNRKK